MKDVGGRSHSPFSRFKVPPPIVRFAPSCTVLHVASLLNCPPPPPQRNCVIGHRASFGFLPANEAASAHTHTHAHYVVDTPYSLCRYFAFKCCHPRVFFGGGGTLMCIQCIVDFNLYFVTTHAYTHFPLISVSDHLMGKFWFFVCLSPLIPVAEMYLKEAHACARAHTDKQMAAGQPGLRRGWRVWFLLWQCRRHDLYSLRRDLHADLHKKKKKSECDGHILIWCTNFRTLHHINEVKF